MTDTPSVDDTARKAVRCYRQFVGRGPTEAQAFHGGDVLVVVMRGVVPPADSGAMRDALIGCVEAVVERRVVSVMASADADADAASCVFILGGPVTSRACGDVLHDARHRSLLLQSTAHPGRDGL
jgi:hypothetical protein